MNRHETVKCPKCGKKWDVFVASLAELRRWIQLSYKLVVCSDCKVTMQREKEMENAS